MTLSTGSAEAGFKGNYAAWKGMEKYGRLMYVQGLLDGFEGAQTSDDENWQIAYRKGWSDCGQALNLNAEMIEGAITRHYESYNRDWSIPPNAVFNRVMGEICFDYVNAARSKLGLPPWKLQTGAMMDTMQQ